MSEPIMTMTQNYTRVARFVGLLFGLALMFVPQCGAFAQSIVVLVNDEPVTSYELAQRQHFLAMSGGINQKMKERLQSSETQQAFREFAMKERPTSKEEMVALQKKFVEHIQKQVMAESSGSLRKAALDQLIDERLMLQAARDQKITVTDEDVNEMLTRMAERGAQKITLKEFLGQLESQGIDPATLKQRVRAQNAWQQVIKRIYGGQLQAEVSSVSTTSETNEDDTVLDVQVVRFAVATPGDQKLEAQRLVDADNLLKKFSDCKALPALVKGMQGVSVKTLSKAKITTFRGDVRAALLKGQVGQMTPPVINGNAIESHAICSKQVSVASGVSQKKDASQDKMREAFELYGRRHLKDLKDRARLEYRKTGDAPAGGKS